MRGDLSKAERANFLGQFPPFIERQARAEDNEAGNHRYLPIQMQGEWNSNIFSSFVSSDCRKVRVIAHLVKTVVFLKYFLKYSENSFSTE